MTTEPTIRDIYYKLGGLESKIDSVLELQKADSALHSHRLDELEEKADELNRRASRLEQIEAKRAGMIIVLVGVFSLISSTIVKFISAQFNLG